MNDDSPLSMIALVIVGFVILLFLSVRAEDGGILGNVATSSVAGNNDTTEITTSSDTFISNRAEESEPPKTESELRSELEQTHYELDEVREAARIAKIWGERSQFEGQIELSTGNIYADDEDEEYLFLSANSSNESAIDISGWLFESYVTGKGATIPFGTEIAYTGRVNQQKPIVLKPGDQAYIATGESPIGTSFKENICTGYFNQFQDFNPYLYEQCPRPVDEMEKFAKIDLDNDNCYEYVEGLQSCRLDLSEAEDANPSVSNRCRNFIINDLTYAGCVDNHRFDQNFNYQFDWRVYLGRSSELWRDEREIIRLLDRDRKTVAVIEID